MSYCKVYFTFVKTSPHLLLPNKFKKIGWFIFIPSTIFGIILCINDFRAAWIWVRVFAIANDGTDSNILYFGSRLSNVTDTVVGVPFIIGALLVSFSKEKNEDEFIAEIRLSSLLWAVWVNYILLLVSFLLVYGSPFIEVMVYNMFTTLLIFIVRFNYLLYRNRKTVPDEK
ncbi:MAG: hypothetical protein E6H10_17830 [Bacteroidetes bacterium]|nr:MAG: hypothetical protein E6H10_17830 [Bacteroidota bacterium]